MPRWARSAGDQGERHGLRRGAWYRVIEDSGKDWVVVDVHHVEIRIPRSDLEVRDTVPQTWSVVHAPHLVCPGCHARLHVRTQPAEMQCHDCGNAYPVDWSDRA